MVERGEERRGRCPIRLGCRIEEERFLIRPGGKVGKSVA